MWQAFQEVREIQKELAIVHHHLENLKDGEDYEPILKKMDRLQRQFEDHNGYELESRIDKLLPELGFKIDDGDRFVSEYSGGWQMRMGLGKILLQSPDLLLLDEPTNHLDLETIEWLEQYLRSLSTPMVIVSHDREFLDRLCTSVVETERGISTTYLGNYSSYLAQKAEAKAAQGAAFERQQKYIDKQQVFVDRFRASATRSTQAKSREKQAEALDLHKDVFHTIHDDFPKMTHEEVRGVLGKFLFSGDTVCKLVRDLSGGEKARLALAKMLLTPVNFLILDEPTNHLDIPAKEMLEAALREYEGTVAVISHDRYFISQVANKIVEIRDGDLCVYSGDYAYYQEKKQEEADLLEQQQQDEAREAKLLANQARQKAKAQTRKDKSRSA